MNFWSVILLIFSLSWCCKLSEGRHHLQKFPPAVVVGTVYCDTCFQQDDVSKGSHYISGATVAVECKGGDSRPGFHHEAKTDKQGKFKVHLPFSVSKHVREIEGCTVKLVKSSEPYCAVASTASSSLIRLKEKKGGKHIFSAGFFTFKPLKQPGLCNQQPSVTRTNLNSIQDLFPDPNPNPNPEIPTLLTPTPFPFPMPTLPQLPPLPSLPSIPGLPTVPSQKPIVPSRETLVQQQQHSMVPSGPGSGEVRTHADLSQMSKLAHLVQQPPPSMVPSKPGSREVHTHADLSQTSKESLVQNGQVLKPQFFFLPPVIPPTPTIVPLPPNPLQPSPLVPNPLQPPAPPLIPNPLQPPTPPSGLLPPVPNLPTVPNLPPIPGVTPTLPLPPPPAVSIPVPMIPIPIPPTPLIPGIPPATIVPKKVTTP